MLCKSAFYRKGGGAHLKVNTHLVNTISGIKRRRKNSYLDFFVFPGLHFPMSSKYFNSKQQNILIIFYILPLINLGFFLNPSFVVRIH